MSAALRAASVSVNTVGNACLPLVTMLALPMSLMLAFPGVVMRRLGVLVWVPLLGHIRRLPGKAVVWAHFAAKAKGTT